MVANTKRIENGTVIIAEKLAKRSEARDKPAKFHVNSAAWIA